MTTRRQIKTSDLNRYEDIIAAAINVTTSTQQITALLDVSSLDELSPLLADLFRSAKVIRTLAQEAMRDAYHDTVIE